MKAIDKFIREVRIPSLWKTAWIVLGNVAIVAMGTMLFAGQPEPHTVGCNRAEAATCTLVGAPATITSNTGYGLTVNASGTDADNEGIFIHQSATGALVYGIHVLADGAATSEYAIKIGTVNAATPISLQTDAGNVVFNAQSGTFQDNGAATFQGPSLTIGLGGTANTNLVEKHNTAPAPSSCGGSPSVTGGNLAFTLTTGSAATACTVTFAGSGFPTNAPTCTVTARTGTNQAGLVFTTSTTALTMSAAAAAALYDVTCIGHV